MDEQKRSKTDKITDAEDQEPAHIQGVGGRHGNGRPGPGGGGYPDICKKNAPAPMAPNNLTDPRLTELVEMGLSPIWLRLASALGVDQFLVAWRILDEENINEKMRDQVRLRVPLFSRYMRYQRNKIIWAFADSGKRPGGIKDIVKNMLSEDLHESHIARIINNRKKLLNDENGNNSR